MCIDEKVSLPLGLGINKFRVHLTRGDDYYMRVLAFIITIYMKNVRIIIIHLNIFCLCVCVFGKKEMRSRLLSGPYAILKRNLKLFKGLRDS